MNILFKNVRREKLKQRCVVMVGKITIWWEDITEYLSCVPILGVRSLSVTFYLPATFVFLLITINIRGPCFVGICAKTG
jgi:hypothetical protein